MMGSNDGSALWHSPATPSSSELSKISNINAPQQMAPGPEESTPDHRVTHPTSHATEERSVDLSSRVKIQDALARNVEDVDAFYELRSSLNAYQK